MAARDGHRDTSQPAKGNVQHSTARILLESLLSRWLGGHPGTLVPFGPQSFCRVSPPSMPGLHFAFNCVASILLGLRRAWYQSARGWCIFRAIPHKCRGSTYEIHSRASRVAHGGLAKPGHKTRYSSESQLARCKSCHFCSLSVFLFSLHGSNMKVIAKARWFVQQE